MTSALLAATRRSFLWLAASPFVASGAMQVSGMEAPSRLPESE